MRILSRLAVPAVLTLAFSVLFPAESRSEVAWRHDLEAARLEAASSGRLLLVHFWSESCEPCRRLDQNVFNQADVATAVGTHYIPIKINTRESPATAEQFKVSSIPYDVILTPAGQVLQAMNSPPTSDQYVAQMTHIATTHQRAVNSRLGTSSAIAVDASRSPQPALNSAYADLPMSPPAGTSAGMAPATSLAAERSGLRSPNVSPTQSAIIPGSGFVTPTVGIGNSNGSVVMPRAEIPAVQNKVAGSAPAGSGSEQERPSVGAVASPTPQLPEGSPELGLDGYCPVTLKERRVWQRGVTQWGAIHRGRTYLFVSAEARQKFFTNPDMYSPVLSGCDPVVALTTGNLVKGRRDFGAEYRGMVFLFSAEDTLQQFEANPEAFHMRVRQAMIAPQDRQLR